MYIPSDPEDGSDVTEKRQLTFTRLHKVIFQKTELFLVTRMRTSSLLCDDAECNMLIVAST
jgi:hypothetical protein